MAELKRWISLNKIFMLAILLIVIFGWMDSVQIQGTVKSQDWDSYSQFIAPAINYLWIIVLIALGIIWYIVTKDLSESLAISLASLIILFGGLEDVSFFIFSTADMTPCMEWFGSPINFVSKNILKETCVSPQGLILNSLLFIGIAYLIFNKLKKAKW